MLLGLVRGANHAESTCDGRATVSHKFHLRRRLISQSQSKDLDTGSLTYAECQGHGQPRASTTSCQSLM